MTLRAAGAARFFALALVTTVTTLAAGDTGQLPRAVVPHLDGTGGATIIEVDPDVPGAKRLLEASPEPIPKRGELIVPPRPTAAPSPTPSPRAGADAGPVSPAVARSPR